MSSPAMTEEKRKRAPEKSGAFFYLFSSAPAQDFAA
jgi:hypothetical protein